jgi:hypothetical protein
MSLRRLSLLLACFATSHALADYEKGLAAAREKRYEEAFKEFQADAERGHPLALEALGFMYSNGQGVEKSDKMAVLYWRLAAMGGVPRAQYMLGLGYGSGSKGLPKNESIAKDWLAKSARRGYAPAKKALAEYYPEVSLEPATGPFLEVRKVEGGRLAFIGQVEGLRWAFIVPGLDVVGAAGQPLMTVDGMLLQVRAASTKDFGDDPGPLLDAYRRWEQKHQRENFADASFGPNSMCRGGLVGYREWTTTFADNAKWKYQVYVGFEVGPTSVLSINSAYGTEEEKAKVARLIGEVCKTFTSDW